VTINRFSVETVSCGSATSIPLLSQVTNNYDAVDELFVTLWCLGDTFVQATLTCALAVLKDSAEYSE
jgi:hypothetical protein